MTSRPKHYWQLYEGSTKYRGLSYGKKKKKLRRQLLQLAKEIVPGTPAEVLVAGVMILIFKCENQLSYRDIAERVNRPGDTYRLLGLKYKPSKSSLHAMADEVAGAGTEFMNAVVSEMAAAYGPAPDLHGDSTGMGLRKNVTWQHAKYGEISKHDFVKLHLITAVHGPIQAFDVTGAHAHDSPKFRKMYGMVQGGTGIVVLDAAYYGHENCDMIAASGRRPVIKPRKGAKANGYSELAKMTRWYYEDRDSFMISYGKRNLAESASMKERTGAQVRAKSLRTQTAELFACVLCYNLAV